MSERKELGKITYAEFGFGGYQTAQFGITFSLSFDGSGVGDFWGAWGIDASEHAKWTDDENNKYLGDMCMRLRKLMEDAKVKKVSELVGIPIEATFHDYNKLKEWRILKEVIL